MVTSDYRFLSEMVECIRGHRREAPPRCCASAMLVCMLSLGNWGRGPGGLNRARDVYCWQRLKRPWAPEESVGALQEKWRNEFPRCFHAAFSCSQHLCNDLTLVCPTPTHKSVSPFLRLLRPSQRVWFLLTHEYARAGSSDSLTDHSRSITTSHSIFFVIVSAAHDDCSQAAGW